MHPSQILRNPQGCCRTLSKVPKWPYDCCKGYRNKQHQQLIWHLKTAKDNHQVFAITSQILKPHNAGGLTHVLATNENGATWEPLETSNRLMNDGMQTSSWPHPAPPQSSTWHGLHAGTTINFTKLWWLNRNWWQSFPRSSATQSPHTPSHLINSQTPTKFLHPNKDTSHPLAFEGLTAGFKKWPEKTAMSPSGLHLGIYKSMLEDLLEKDDHKQSPPKFCSIYIMHTVHTLLQLAIKHTHTFQCWQV